MSSKTVTAKGFHSVPDTRRQALILLLPSVTVLVLFFLLPLLGMLVTSFQEFTGPVRQANPAYTLDNYIKFFADGFYLSVLLRTVWISALVAVLAVAMGYPLAYFLARSDSRWKGLVIAIVALPLITNLVVRNYGWMVIFSQNGVLNSILQTLGLPRFTLMFTEMGVILALTQVLAPYAVFSLFGVIQQINPRLEESARNLGGTSWHVFKDVLVPLSLIGLASAFMLIFVQAMAAFATPLLVGGGGKAGQLISTIVYTDATLSLNWPFAAASSFVLNILVLLLIAVQGWLLRDKRVR